MSGSGTETPSLYYGLSRPFDLRLPTFTAPAAADLNVSFSLCVKVFEFSVGLVGIACREYKLASSANETPGGPVFIFMTWI